MRLAAVTLFGVPITGSFPTLLLAAFVFSLSATGMGLLASTVTSSQIAALFLAMIGTIIPTMQFAGMINPGVFPRRECSSDRSDVSGEPHVRHFAWRVQ